MTTERAIHLAFGLMLVFLLTNWKKNRFNGEDYAAFYIMGALGTWVPDWDLIFGLGFHRSPITHGVFPWLLVFFLARRFGSVAAAPIGFAIGLASHLIWDTIFYGDVRMISGGNNDRIYLLGSAGVLILISLIHLLLAYYKSSNRDSVNSAPS